MGGSQNLNVKLQHVLRKSETYHTGLSLFQT